MQTLDIYEYVGPKNNQGIESSTPFLLISFCDGEWELSQTNWNDVNNHPENVYDLFDGLAVTLYVLPNLFEEYFKFSRKLEYDF